MSFTGQPIAGVDSSTSTVTEINETYEASQGAQQDPNADKPWVAASMNEAENADEALRKAQTDSFSSVNGNARFPKPSDFPGLVVRILDKDVDDISVKHCMILLHDLGGNEKALIDLARRLQKKHTDTAFLLLRGPYDLQPVKSGYAWTIPELEPGRGFMNSNDLILSRIIKDGLINKCHFRPREIVLVGHSQGGKAALAAAATCSDTELGGSVSIGGLMPEHKDFSNSMKARTPALLLDSTSGKVSTTAAQHIQEIFNYVHHSPWHGASDKIPEGIEIQPIYDFLAHRLNREEWMKQAVISFDGGGIRGYASLLILKELMNKIGDEEKRLDETIMSSFDPYEYKPSEKPLHHKSESVHSREANLDNSENNMHRPDLAQQGHDKLSRPQDLDDLDYSPYFLPCHYFTYAAGTSTGGLISIMLSRFRMTVDDCIVEYKTLGEQIFGKPRPFAKGGILWSKYSHRALESAIENVTRNHSEISEFPVNYPLDEDVCRCIVLAYADFQGADAPYLFRTYGTFAPETYNAGSRSDPTNYGPAPNISIKQVARATTAAPGYFRQIEIPRGNAQESTRFLDGGFGSNNPSHDAYLDILNKHGGMASMCMGPFVSIGTGDSELKMFPEKSGNPRRAMTNLRTAMKLPSRSIKAHLHMLRVSRHDNQAVFPYYRFDGGEHLGKIKMDAWQGDRFRWLTRKRNVPGYKTLAEMENATNLYLKDRKVQRQLEKCAEDLVRRRRLRTRDASEWDRYASFSYYECDNQGCQKKHHISKANEFKQHMLSSNKHQVADEAINDRMKQCRRIYWTYRKTDRDR